MKILNEEWSKQFESEVFKLDKLEFEESALRLFQFQYLSNATYRNYCELLGIKASEIKKLTQIPFLPISLFKSHELKSTAFDANIIFTSSGTTGSVSSKHFVKNLNLYEDSFFTTFEKFYGSVEDYCVLGLLPSYLERSGSSLVYMVQKMIEKSGDERSGFFLNNQKELEFALAALATEKKKTLLIGVSFGLLDFLETHEVPANPELIVMETGGMKGRRREMIREELHSKLSEGFKLEKIHSEYGMTELLSQAYSFGFGNFETPNWMRVLVRKQDDPFNYAAVGETGAINVIDLANIYSCAFIQTDDLGKLNEDGTFQVLGRFDASEVRGCNLMVT